MSSARSNPINTAAMHGALIIYTLIALFPVFVILINSFKTRKKIFREPLALPDADSFSLVGYQTVMKQGDFFLYFQNSFIVTVGSLTLILLFGAMAAFALSEYRFRGNMLMGLYLALGIMIPIRIGTVAILEMMVSTGLVNTLWALILVYTAQGLPLAVFILNEFMRQVSDDLKNAGRIDGLSEFTIFFKLVLPLVRPALATVAELCRYQHDPDLERSVVPADPRPGRGNQDADAWQSGVYRPVRDRLERGSVGAVDGDPAGSDPLCDLLPPAHSRHHVRGGEMMVFLLTTEGQCPVAERREGSNRKGATS